MEVTVEVDADTARSLQKQQPPTPASEQIAKATAELGVVLQPMHPGADDPRLVRFFMIHVPDPEAAKQVVGRFRQITDVYAYLKPRPELPESPRGAEPSIDFGGSHHG